MSLQRRIASLICGAFVFAGASALAGTIQVEFTGLDLTYDGATITDVSANGDTLNSVSILEDGVAVAGSPFGSDIEIDLVIPDVTIEDLAVDSTLSAAGGTLSLSLPGGDFLNLDLGAVAVTYVNTGQLKASFGGTVANVQSQSLPTSLALGSPAEVTFSSNISTLTSSNGFVDFFLASGSGEISGPAIPEPASILLVGLAGVAAAARRR